MDRESKIIQACEAIVKKDRRPSARSVSAWLREKHGGAPGYRDMLPVLRRWKEARHDSRAVDRAVSAYLALDAEQKTAFRDQVKLYPQPPSRA